MALPNRSITPPPNNSREEDDNDDTSSVRTDLTTLPSSNVRRVTVRANRWRTANPYLAPSLLPNSTKRTGSFFLCTNYLLLLLSQLSPEGKMAQQPSIPAARPHLEAILRQIPEQDRDVFVSGLLRKMENHARNLRVLPPNTVRRLFCFVVETEDVDDNIVHHGQQIEMYFNNGDTHEGTLSLLRAQERERAAAAAAQQQPQVHRAAGRPPALVVADENSEASSSLESGSAEQRARQNQTAMAQPPSVAAQRPPARPPSDLDALIAAAGFDSGNSGLTRDLRLAPLDWR